MANHCPRYWPCRAGVFSGACWRECGAWKLCRWLVTSQARRQAYVPVATAQDGFHVVRAVAGGGGARLQEPRPMLPIAQRRPKWARISARRRGAAWPDCTECMLEWPEAGALSVLVHKTGQTDNALVFCSILPHDAPYVSVCLQTSITCSMIRPSLACCPAARVVMTSTYRLKESAYGARAGDHCASPREAGCPPPRYGSREYHGDCGCRAD